MRKLMCYYHWRFVPPSLQRAISAAWNGGQCTPDHATLCKAAAQIVNQKVAALRPAAPD